MTTFHVLLRRLLLKRNLCSQSTTHLQTSSNVSKMLAVQATAPQWNSPSLLQFCPQVLRSRSLIPTFSLFSCRIFEEIQKSFSVKTVQVY